MHNRATLDHFYIIQLYGWQRVNKQTLHVKYITCIIHLPYILHIAAIICDIQAWESLIWACAAESPVAMATYKSVDLYLVSISPVTEWQKILVKLAHPSKLGGRK